MYDLPYYNCSVNDLFGNRKLRGILIHLSQLFHEVHVRMHMYDLIGAGPGPLHYWTESRVQWTKSRGPLHYWTGSRDPVDQVQRSSGLDSEWEKMCRINLQGMDLIHWTQSSNIMDLWIQSTKPLDLWSWSIGPLDPVHWTTGLHPSIMHTAYVML